MIFNLLPNTYTISRFSNLLMGIFIKPLEHNLHAIMHMNLLYFHQFWSLTTVTIVIQLKLTLCADISGIKIIKQTKKKGSYLNAQQIIKIQNYDKKIILKMELIILIKTAIDWEQCNTKTLQNFWRKYLKLPICTTCNH